MDRVGMNTLNTPVKSQLRVIGSSISPNISRYGRIHKPKMQEDYVSTDKKVSAILKFSPGNQIQYFTPSEPKKKTSPKKLEGSPRRGRPPKSPSKDSGVMDIAKIEIKVEPQDPNSPVDGCEWMVGDLAWARVGGHPFWPCIIALDPVQKIFTKTVRKGRTTVSQRWVHVQFFGDNGRRSWLNSSSVMCYNGRDAFIQLGDTILAGMRKKEPKQTSAFVIKPAVIQVWEKAVQEAEDVVNVSREDRTAFFRKRFPTEVPPSLERTREELIEMVLTSPETPKNRGRKRKAEQSPMEEEIKKKQIKLEEVKEEVNERVDPLLSSTPRTIADRKKRQALLMQLARSNQPASNTCSSATSPTRGIVKECPISPVNPVVKMHPLKRLSIAESTSEVKEKKPKKKYVKNKVAADYKAFSSKHFDRVSDDHPELSVKEVNKYLQKMWNEMDDTQKAKYRSRLGNQDKEDSEYSEETSEGAETEDQEEEVRSSKSSSPAPIAVATQKPTAAKRNNFKYLFSGAKSEKVCQICERAGDTVRCRGPCQGYYHPDCVTNPQVTAAQESSIFTPGKKGKKRGRPKKSLSNSPHPTSTQGGNDENGSLSPKEVDMQVKDNENKLKINGFDKKPDEKDLVEIIEPELKTVGKARKGSKDSESCSSEEGEGFRCKDCQEGRSQPCFVCQEYIHKKSGEAKLYRCVTAYCGKVYHEGCLKLWPQTSWRSNGCDRGVLTCPQHTCHTCASDNPGVIKARYSNDKLVRCVRCPTTYHYGNYCLPAGCEILTNTQVICPQHYKPTKKALIQHINAAWCFICASGGSLICCDLCPTSFHADCLNISTPPDGSYVCDDCQTGRFPLYGEIVWVKLGTYRWWPAEILYPVLIPDNIYNLPHVRGEFAVKFFGSHDHYWVNRGRVFLYQDGDTAGKSNYKKSSVDNVFERAVREASEAQRKYLEEKATRDAETRPGMKPPNYVKLKTNKSVGNVRTMELNLSNLTPCECDPKSEAPCAPDSDCLNRILMVECHPLVCPAGEKCCNQLFEKRQYPPLQPYHTQGRGWGLKTLVALKKGDFVIEYVGEMIDEEEYKKRLVQMHENNEENFYFLTIDKDRMLDAGPKGNVARFMNHSCHPNCETQKWTVNGDTRVGLFALFDIPAGTELVFNYNLESIGTDKKRCMCGAPNCSGFIGVKANKNQEKEETKEKKTVKKKKSTAISKTHEEDCFVCGEGGELLLCDGKYCTKGYHLTCLGKKQRAQGYWLCPWHQCNICNKGRVQRCTFCVNSFCQEHSEGNIRLDPVKGLLCHKHDQEKSSDHSKVLEGETTNCSVKITDEHLNQDTSIVPSPEAVELPAQVEITNNNLLKTEIPARRMRRSTSDTPRTERVINGTVQKLSKRKARPSSIDDNLIVPNKKTQQSRYGKTDAIKSHKVVTELLDEILITLPIKETPTSEMDTKDKNNEEKEEETVEQVKIVNISDVDNKGELSKEEVVSEVEDDNLQKKIDTIGEGELTEHINTQTTSSESFHDAKTSKKQKNQLITTDKKNHYEQMETGENIDSNHDDVTINSLSENCSETKKDLEKTSNLECVIPKDSLCLNGPIKDTEQFIDTIDVNENANESKSNRNNDSLDHMNESHINKKDTMGDSSDKLTKDNFDMEKMSEELYSDKCKNDVQDSQEEEKKINNVEGRSPSGICINNICENKHKNNKGAPAASTSLDVDDHVDDFELSYSECSNDKLYKSINISESSLEMKLSDCMSPENSENKRISNKKKESELVNCIEQSSAMEVA